MVSAVAFVVSTATSQLWDLIDYFYNKKGTGNSFKVCLIFDFCFVCVCFVVTCVICFVCVFFVCFKTGEMDDATILLAVIGVKTCYVWCAIVITVGNNVSIFYFFLNNSHGGKKKNKNNKCLHLQQQAAESLN